MGKTISSYLVIIIIAIFTMVVFGGVVIHKYWWPPKEIFDNRGVPADLSQVKTQADWQTYRNEKMGFELKFPRFCDLHDYSSSKYSDVLLIYFYPEETARTRLDTDAEARLYIKITDYTEKKVEWDEIEATGPVSDISRKCTPEEYWKYGCDDICRQYGGEKRKELLIDGYPAISIFNYSACGPKSGKDCVVARNYVCVEHKPLTLLQLIIDDPSDESVDAYTTVFDQMLATFKFLTN